MGNCSCSTDENGFDFDMEMDANQLLFLQSNRKQFSKDEKAKLDKLIKQRVMNSVIKKTPPE